MSVMAHRGCHDHADTSAKFLANLEQAREQTAIGKLDPSVAGRIDLATENNLRGIAAVDTGNGSRVRATKAIADGIGQATKEAFGWKPIPIVGNVFLGVQHRGRVCNQP